MSDLNQLNFSRALHEAVTVPGSVMLAYSAFYEYSFGNQLLALIQCRGRGLQPGPLRTYKGWLENGRQVRRGEHALTLCMPVTYKPKHSSDTAPGELAPDDVYATAFVYKPRWFVLDQTEGEEFQLPTLPDWNPDTALENLDITRVPFVHLDGNCQGYARGRELAINPVAQIPHKTLLHETAHIVLGHTLEHEITDGERTPRNLREVEAESVALLCIEALGFDGSEFCRGYIQNWLEDEEIPEASAKKILGAAQRVLKAGRADFNHATTVN